MIFGFLCKNAATNTAYLGHEIVGKKRPQRIELVQKESSAYTSVLFPPPL